MLTLFLAAKFAIQAFLRYLRKDNLKQSILP